MSRDVQIRPDTESESHVIPRYADDPRPSWPFPFSEVDPTAIDEEPLTRDVQALRLRLG